MDMNGDRYRASKSHRRELFHWEDRRGNVRLTMAMILSWSMISPVDKYLRSSRNTIESMNHEKTEGEPSLHRRHLSLSLSFVSDRLPDTNSLRRRTIDHRSPLSISHPAKWTLVFPCCYARSPIREDSLESNLEVKVVHQKIVVDHMLLQSIEIGHVLDDDDDDDDDDKWGKRWSYPVREMNIQDDRPEFSSKTCWTSTSSVFADRMTSDVEWIVQN